MARALLGGMKEELRLSTSLSAHTGFGPTWETLLSPDTTTLSFADSWMLREAITEALRSAAIGAYDCLQQRSAAANAAQSLMARLAQHADTRLRILDEKLAAKKDIKLDRGICRQRQWV